jgi:glycosyltransferase involved in cell wall biosynthesis
MVGGAQRKEEQHYLDSLKDQAAELGVADRVRFLGQRSDVPRILKAADIFCQPNEGPEPFGIVFIEALGAGLPVVTTNFGGATEIVTDQEGYLTPPGDHRLLADSLRGLINSPEERRRLSRSGPSRARTLCDPVTQMRRLHESLSGCVRDATSVHS